VNGDCIFCSIAAGSIPANVVAETDGVIAFRDLNPAAPTHVLVVPKAHVADSAADLDRSHAGMLGEVFSVAADVARAEGLDRGWRLVTNAGTGAGQTVFHLHFHVLGGWAAANEAPALADESGG
jgi:histidine triad (HIT) family protein